MVWNREHKNPRSSCVPTALGQTATGIDEGIMLISIEPYFREHHLSRNKYVICTIRHLRKLLRSVLRIRPLQVCAGYVTQLAVMRGG
jgi:hypothetical protein